MGNVADVVESRLIIKTISSQILVQLSQNFGVNVLINKKWIYNKYWLRA